ncbi:MAG: peptidoglycan bridge formation glycyltransferase FemA/FemB family protein [Lachnospiraceae bacterium]|nr:peptidoglycan bridge formation glycyltransferase FemA/FemB family protein [Lachnospiraceae bacterium]
MVTICRYEELSSEVLSCIVNANVFFQKCFVEYARLDGEEIYYCFDEERIVPVRFRKKIIFKLGVFPSEPYNLVEMPQKELRNYLDEIMFVLKKKLGIQWCNSTASAFFLDTPTVNCKRIPFGSHVIELNNDEEVLWGNINSKHRNVIRKAEKEGVIILVGGEKLLDDYVTLESETTNRTGRASSGLNYYSKQVTAFGNNIKVYIAYHEGIPQAGGIFYVNNAFCYYMYGATKRDSVTGSANLLIWTAIKDMKDAGVQRFSFVGCRINEDPDSKYHGIQRFKERFGGALQVGYMFRCENKPRRYKLFCKVMQIRLHKKTIYQDPVDEEIHKWTDIQVHNEG